MEKDMSASRLDPPDDPDNKAYIVVEGATRENGLVAKVFEMARKKYSRVIVDGRPLDMALDDQRRSTER
jgi:hypothetical protein